MNIPPADRKRLSQWEERCCATIPRASSPGERVAENGIAWNRLGWSLRLRTTDEVRITDLTADSFDGCLHPRRLAEVHVPVTLRLQHRCKEPSEL
jgi:hypothetical protein